MATINFFEDDRLSQILKIIQKKPFVTLTYLAERIDVSTRTIRNDIKLLNDELEGVAFLEGEQGSYRLHVTDQKGFEQKIKSIYFTEDYFNYPQKRMAFIIQTLMRNDEPYLIDDLAFDMNVGRTTLTGDLKKLKEILKPYSLDIIGKTNSGIGLSGSEIDLRFFVLENMYDTIYYKYPLDKEIIDIVKTAMDRYYFETSTEVEFLKAVTLMLDRLLTNHAINSLDEKYYGLIKSPAFEIAEVVSRNVEKELQISIPLEEKIFIALPIVGMRTPTNIDFLSSKDINENSNIMVEKILNRIKYELNLEIMCDGFCHEFAYHISFMINRLLFGFRLKNHISKEVKEKYPLAYKMAKIAGRVIEEEYNVVVTEDELGYLTAYFGVFILENNIKTEKDFRVAIICGTGRGTAMLIAAQLKKILDKSTIMELFADNKVTPEILKQYSFIFSTVKLPFKTETPVIIINEIFDEKEIMAQVEALKYLKKVDMPFLPGNASIMAAILEDDRFFVLDSHKSYIENTRFMIESMIKNGYLDCEFEKRIEEREEKSSMIFDRMIAFPHTINKASDSIIFALGVIPTPIVEGDREIKLIFLLGLPESEDNDILLVKIYDEIISIAQRSDVIDAISKTSNFKELIRYFIKISDLFK